MQSQMNQGAILDLSSEPGMDPSLRRWETGPVAFLMFLATLIVPAVLLFVLYQKQFNGLINADAMDFAQLGRNMSSGQGYHTYILRPLALTNGDNPRFQPDVTHGPLYPLVLASLFGMFGVSDKMVAVASGVFYVLTCPILFFLGSRVFSKPVGLIGALAFAFSVPSLEYALSGLHITLFIFLTSLLLLVTYYLALFGQHMQMATEAGGWAPLPRLLLVIAGLLTVSLYLTDYNFFPLLPVMLVAIALIFRGQKIKASLFFLIPALVLAAPVMLRNAKFGGNPIWGLRAQELWMHTDKYPGYSMYRMAPGFLRADGLGGDIFEKVLDGLNRLVQSFPETGSAWIFGFFLVSLCFRFYDEPANRLRSLLVWMIVGLIAGTLVFQVPMLQLLAFVPAMLVFGIAFAVYMLQQGQRSVLGSVALYGFIGLILVFPAVHRLATGEKPRAAGEKATAVALEDGMRKDDVCLSDEPWLVAWYGNHPAMWVPQSDTELVTLRNRFKSMRWLMLTERARTLSPDWQEIYTVFRRWNEMCVVARQTKKPIPGPLQVQGKGRPLVEALQGFVTIAPTEKTDVTTAVAVLPPPANARKAPRTP